MSVRDSHVPLDRLTALALVARAPESDLDRSALLHVARCDRCASALAELTAELHVMREAAWEEADAVFDEPMLEAQRVRILDRLAHLGQAARVLRFPVRPRDTAMPVSNVSRRWVSVAAAAGLIIGLVAGQLLQFVPWEPLRPSPVRALAPARPGTGTGTPVIVQASTGGSGLSDDELLDAVEAAVQLRRAHSLRALDALTPTAVELREIR